MAGSDDDARRGRWIALGATLGSFAVAAVVGWSLLDFLAGSETALARIRRVREGELTTVPSFARDLGRGTVITADHLAPIRIPEAMVPDEAIRDGDLAIGRTLTEPVLAGDLVRRERFARSAATGLRALVPPGFRAIALDLDPTAYVSGSVRPGNRVDVIVTLPGPDDRPAETETVVRSAEVLAVNEWISETAMGEPIAHSQITLAVAPADGLRLTHATAVARGSNVRLSLVGELEGLIRTGSDPPARPLGSPDRRLDVATFRERFSENDVDAMYRAYFGDDPAPAAIVDPAWVRPLVVPADPTDPR